MDEIGALKYLFSGILVGMVLSWLILWGVRQERRELEELARLEELWRMRKLSVREGKAGQPVVAWEDQDYPQDRYNRLLELRAKYAGGR